MDFEYSEKSKAWIKRVSDFMDKHIYPNVKTFEEQHEPPATAGSRRRSCTT